MASVLRAIFSRALMLPCLLVAGTVAGAQADAARDAKSGGAAWSLCSESSRMTALDLAMDDGKLLLTPVCVRDDQGAVPASVPVRVPLPPGVGMPLSVHAPEALAYFQVVKRRVTRGLETEVNLRDGTSCVRISVTERGRSPLPGRFLPLSRDWRQGTDYLIDPACKLLLVRVGNRVAWVLPGHESRIDLYGLRFSFQPNLN